MMDPRKSSCLQVCCLGAGVCSGCKMTLLKNKTDLVTPCLTPLMVPPAFSSVASPRVKHVVPDNLAPESLQHLSSCLLPCVPMSQPHWVSPCSSNCHALFMPLYLCTSLLSSRYALLPACLPSELGMLTDDQKTLLPAHPWQRSYSPSCVSPPSTHTRLDHNAYDSLFVRTA